jgi:hypothetical protein
MEHRLIFEISGGHLTQRFRPFKVFLIAFAVAIVWVVAVFVIMDTGDQRTDYYRGRWLEALLYPVLVMQVVAFFGLILYRLKWANDVKEDIDELRQHGIPDANTSPTPPGFPVIEVIPEYSPPTDGPGKYRVEGVDRKTEMDTTLHVHADSAANAKVKAELQDIVVTAVAKE